MTTMGKYCKAYPLNLFRQFSQWREQTENLRKDKQEINGQELEIDRELTDDDFLYLQENYVVTDGIFQDKNIIFDKVTDEWKKFCDQTLGFEVPVYEPVTVNAQATSDSSDTNQS